MNKTNEKQAIYRQSKQRERILYLLRSTTTHPTADWLYDNLKKEFPNLSLGTIYRNLTILIEQGLVRKIRFGSTFDRFEANITPHYHLICEQCGKMQDFDMPVDMELNDKASQFTDFKVQRHKLEFYGICKSCSEKQ